MKPSIKSILAIIFLTAFAGAYCENKSLFSLIFSGGLNYGGIVSAGKMDAVTSASKMGVHAGVHTEIDIYGHFLETGLDYSYFNQDLVFKDASKNIDGKRSFALQSITLPVLYNFHFFNRDNGDPYLTAGIGIFCAFYPFQEIKESGTLSGYHLNNWTAGPFFSLKYYPLDIEEKYLLGLYLNLYRSFSRFYTDDYFIDSHAGDAGICDFGLTLKYQL